MEVKRLFSYFLVVLQLFVLDGGNRWMLIITAEAAAASARPSQRRFSEYRTAVADTIGSVAAESDNKRRSNRKNKRDNGTTNDSLNSSLFTSADQRLTQQPAPSVTDYSRGESDYGSNSVSDYSDGYDDFLPSSFEEFTDSSIPALGVNLIEISEPGDVHTLEFYNRENWNSSIGGTSSSESSMNDYDYDDNESNGNDDTQENQRLKNKRKKQSANNRQTNKRQKQNSSDSPLLSSFSSSSSSSSDDLPIDNSFEHSVSSSSSATSGDSYNSISDHQLRRSPLKTRVHSNRLRNTN